MTVPDTRDLSKGKIAVYPSRRKEFRIGYIVISLITYAFLEEIVEVKRAHVDEEVKEYDNICGNEEALINDLGEDDDFCTCETDEDEMVNKSNKNNNNNTQGWSEVTAIGQLSFSFSGPN